MDESEKRVFFEENQHTMYAGEVSVIPAVVESESKKETVSYESSDREVAQVSQNGVVTALTAGEARITAKLNDGQQAVLTVTVVEPEVELAFSQDSVTISKGEEYAADVQIKTERLAAVDLTYFCTDKKIASVDEQGKITGLSAGEAYVYAKDAESGAKAQMKITVTQTLEAVRFQEISRELSVGESFVPILDTGDYKASEGEFEYSVFPEGIIEFSDGEITGICEGSATLIAAHSETGKKAAMKIKITENEVKVIDGVTYINSILIVNKTYGLPKDYNKNGGLTAETQGAFEKMKKAAAEDGITLNIASGYRSYEYQSLLFNKYLLRGQGREYVETYSARPGHSEHQTGLAIDVNMASDAFEGTPEQKWLNEHCVEYGFIIRYPEGKEEYTGYKYEPWHIRYVGTQTAQEISASGLCLEEFFEITSKYCD